MTRRSVFIFFATLILVLSACSTGTPTPGAPASETPSLLTLDLTRTAPEPTNPPVVVSLTPMNTVIPPVPTPIPPTPTQTPVPCDPVNGYCIQTGHFFLDRPIALPGTITIDRGYPFGTTENGSRDPHHGVEFYNASGTPVLAAADGLVMVAGSDSQAIYAIFPNSYGNIIILKHRFPYVAETLYTVYGHLSEVEVQVGQTVHAGDEIGKVGATGAAIGSHLHFEVREGSNDFDSDRNPVLWLKPLPGQDNQPFGVLAGRLEDAQGKPVHVLLKGGLNIQYFPDPKGPQSVAYQVETYDTSEQHSVKADDAWDENFTLGDIAAGNYRISLMWGGKLYDHWIVVEPGKVTFFIFQIGQ
jgi:murein DD-endopeptidase MepM/ murein hydrolase activator NlpD